MTEYTPETEEVRESYVIRTFNRDMEHLRAEAFDRWLAAHDAEKAKEVRTATLEEAADQWSEWETFRASDGIISIRQHGLSTKEWLRARALGE